MRIFLITLTALVFLQGGILDFVDINKAKEAYEKKNYDATISHLNGLKDSLQKPSLEYNLGNAYYKKNKYEEALKHYKKAKGVDEANRLYNMGNAYANSGDIDEAIKAYEESLKIRDDVDTKKNLELLKKKKEQQQKQQDQKNNDQKNNDQNKQDQNSSNQKNNQNKQDQQKNDQNKKDNAKDNNSKKEDQNETKNAQPQVSAEQKEQALSDKQIKHLMEKLKSKKMPTMMYGHGDPKEEKDEKPW